MAPGAPPSSPSSWNSLPVEQEAIRDQFAAAAITGLLSCALAPSMNTDAAVELAFQVADKMMNRRKK